MFSSLFFYYFAVSILHMLGNRIFYEQFKFHAQLFKANNKGADQSAQMRRLVCASIVRKPPKSEAQFCNLQAERRTAWILFI